MKGSYLLEMWLLTCLQRDFLVSRDFDGKVVTEKLTSILRLWPVKSSPGLVYKTLATN